MPEHSTPDRLTNRVRALRFERGEMTQQQLADAAGVSRQTINAAESGKHGPSLELAFRIARALGAPLEDVFSYGPLAD